MKTEREQIEAMIAKREDQITQLEAQIEPLKDLLKSLQGEVTESNPKLPKKKYTHSADYLSKKSQVQEQPQVPEKEDFQKNPNLKFKPGKWTPKVIEFLREEADKYPKDEIAKHVQEKFGFPVKVSTLGFYLSQNKIFVAKKRNKDLGKVEEVGIFSGGKQVKCPECKSPRITTYGKKQVAHPSGSAGNKQMYIYDCTKCDHRFDEIGREYTEKPKPVKKALPEVEGDPEEKVDWPWDGKNEGDEEE